MVKLLDFGVAQVAQSEHESRSDAVKGKFGYLSPEQTLAKPLDGRSDVFALGICLYETLTMKRLYKRPNQFETFKAILQDPVPSIRAIDDSLPADLDAIVQKALAKSASDRYQSAGELQQALEEWLAGAMADLLSGAPLPALLAADHADVHKLNVGHVEAPTFAR